MPEAMPGIDVNGIISGGGFAVFTIFAGYIITKFLPSVMETFREEIKSERDSHEKTTIMVSEAIRDNGREIILVLKELEANQKRFSEILLKHDIQLDIESRKKPIV